MLHELKGLGPELSIGFSLNTIAKLPDLIARNVAIKARIVENDELETLDIRALLNFGHTIGHGIEAAVPYGTILHGEAVALGMRAALVPERTESRVELFRRQEDSLHPPGSGTSPGSPG